MGEENKRNIIFILFYIFFLYTISAGYSADNITEIKFDHLTIDDGLANSTVKHIIQDQRGFIWFATLNMLNRFDGYELKTYQHIPGNMNSISGDRITALIESQDENLIIGTSQYGIDILNLKNDRIKHYRHNISNNQSLASNQVDAIYQDKKNRIWIGTHNVLNLFNKEKGTFLHYYLPEKEESIVAITEFSTDELWICTNQLKIFSFNCISNTFDEKNIIPPGHQGPHIWRSKFYTDSKNILWISTVINGLYRYDKNSGEIKNFRHDPANPFSLKYNDVYDIVEDKNNCYWIATDGGGLNYFNYNNQTFNAILNNPADKNTIANNKLISILKDNTDILWIGSSNGGVSYYDKNKEKFKVYKHDPNNPGSLSHNIVWSFFEDNEGDILIGTDRGGLNIFNPSKNDRFTRYVNDPDDPSSIPSNTIISIFQDSKGRIWLGTYNHGLILFDKHNKSFTSLKARENYKNNPLFLAGNDVWDIEEDESGNIWLATLRYGVDVYNPEKKEFKHFNVENSNLSNNKVTTILRDNKNQMWIGTADGLNLYDKKNNLFIVFKQTGNDTSCIPGNNIRVIFEDSNKDLWIGTEGFGICHMNYNNYLCHNYSQLDGLPSNIIYGIVEDNSGNLWISTSRGLSKFDKKNNIFRNFTTKEGLQSIEFKQNACLKTKNGTMLFGGINGFNIFHPDSIKYNQIKPKVYITNFYIFNKPVLPQQKGSVLTNDISQTKEITLNYKQSFISFTFAALNYTIPEKNNYAYMLEGFDENWNKTGNKREATYTNLDPGKYVFKVIASNNDNIWNMAGCSLNIRILPPWWKTLLFRILLAITILSGLILFHYIRLYAINKQKKILEKEVKKRTAELNEAVENLKFSRDEIIAQNEEIQQQTEEIVTQRDELQLNKEELEKTHDRLKTLNNFGQELTTVLDLNEINNMIYNYVSSLLDTSVFGIGIYNEERNCIDFYSLIENGQHLPSFSSSLFDSTSCAAWCFRNNESIFSNNFETDYKNFISELNIRSSKNPESVIYVPFSVKNIKKGVLTAQSYLKKAYTENDMNTLQTLASYLAIALDNANAYKIVNKQKDELEIHRSKLELLVHERTKDLEAAKLKAEESDRLKSAFLANMSHEIRTPLNAIIGFTELILDDDFSDFNREEIKQIIQQNTYSLLNLINDIIDFSKIEAGEINIYKSNVDIKILLVELFQIYSEDLKRKRKNNQIQLYLDNNYLENNIKIFTDGPRLKQIMVNFLDNAIKYTNEGYIKFGIEECDKKYITFYIEDTGIGIDHKNFEIIFERFRKVEEKDQMKIYRGTGLGLSITKYLIEKLGGEIWLKSEVNKGSKFNFNLPLQSGNFTNKEEGIHDSSKKNEKKIPDWHEKTVLIVEDEESNFSVIKSMLKKSNINILRAKDGNKAVQIFEEMNSKIDIVLLDIKLPGRNGILVAEKMKQKNKSIPIIAQTAYALPEEESKIRELKFDEYISKPIDKNILIQLMKKFLS